MKNSELNILVTDGQNRSTLAVVRSLGRAGHRLIVTSPHRRSIAGSSKYCWTRYRVTDPLKEPAQFSQDIIALVDRLKVDVVIPMTEVAIYTLNSARKRLMSKCILASSDADRFDVISDKFQLFQNAKKLNVPIPNTIFIENPSDLNSKLERIQHYPAVIKPGQSKIRTGNVFISTSVRYADSPRELIRLYKTDPALHYPSMIQEKIEGPGTGLFTLFDKSRHLALFSHQRIREKPPSGGVSVVCQSVAIDHEMARSARKLLEYVNWQGVAMVEFKRDLKDGKAKLMEINGRFWGSLQLAVSSGVDFPYLFLNYLCGRKPSSYTSAYRLGLKMKWFLGTLDHMLIRLKSPTHTSLANNTANEKLKAIQDFLKIYDHRTTFDVFSTKDLNPFVTELKQYLCDLFR